MSAAPFTLTQPNQHTLREWLETEWLLTNGLGGYAMGTLLGANRRRYHGLLIAAHSPPVRRFVALHSVIEQLVLPPGDHGDDERVIDLTTHMFAPPEAHGCEPLLHPKGWRHLRGVNVTHTSVEWRWECDDVQVARTLVFAHGWNGIRLRYSITSSEPVTLRVRPLTPLRGFHDLCAHDDPVPTVQEDAGWSIERGGRMLLMSWDSEAGAPDRTRTRARIEPQAWERFGYGIDRERYQDWQENVWSPGVIEFTHDGDGTRIFHVCAATDRKGSNSGPFDECIEGSGLTHPSDAPVKPALEHAADQFIVSRQRDRESSTSIIAGYPWFADWGRDAMIALPGLLLSTKRIRHARSVLHTFARSMRYGLIPNRFDDEGGEPHYNTVDASLWFIHAVWQYHAAIGAVSDQGIDHDQLDSALTDACRSIIRAYRHGIRIDDPREGYAFGIGMNADGLITAGNEQSQLTWMDARRDGVSFTPRHGIAVEINALWHNALWCLSQMVQNDDEAAELREIAGRVAIGFQMQFWWSERGCLHDVLALRETSTLRLADDAAGGSANPHGASQTSHQGSQDVLAPDHRLRPNQIFAASLPFSPITQEQARCVVAVVRERLLTPFGLRTLDPDDPEYRGRFEGDMFDRDAAYHNGTAWPWLMGPFCEAVLRVDDFSARAREDVEHLIEPLAAIVEHRQPRMDDEPFGGFGCVGQLAEIFDGDPPHQPHGCPAQAWSVAELLRIRTMLRP